MNKIQDIQIFVLNHLFYLLRTSMTGWISDSGLFRESRTRIRLSLRQILSRI